MIQELLPQAERIAAKLKARGETISIAESSTAGLISAALLAIPGASAYFLGGAVVYTRQSRTELLAVTEQELITFCKERMAAYKYPRVVELVEEVPKTETGKFLRRLLRDRPGRS